MNCNFIAPWYYFFEYIVFKQALDLQRNNWVGVAEVLASKKILILGEGDGRFLSSLIPNISVTTSIDIIEKSSRMLEIAKKRNAKYLLHYPHIQFRCDDALNCINPHLDISLLNKYDIVITHFFLDCFSGSNLSKLITNIALVLKDNGTWFVTDFQTQLLPKANIYHRLRAKLLVQLMYGFFRIFTGLETQWLEDYSLLLKQNHLQLCYESSAQNGFIRSQCWKKRQTLAK